MAKILNKWNPFNECKPSVFTSTLPHVFSTCFPEVGPLILNLYFLSNGKCRFCVWSDSKIESSNQSHTFVRCNTLEIT